MAREIASDSLTKQQKTRAQRIDHWYYRKPHPWRSRMRMLSWGAPILSVVVLVGFMVLPKHKEAVFLPGPVSTKHAIFGQNCSECHQGGSPHWGAVTDDKCSSCHDGPAHHTNMKYPGGNTILALDGGKAIEVETPTCASCHAEHGVNMRLADIPDRHCSQCHENLKGEPAPAFASGIKSFVRGHPEWAVLKNKTPDEAKILLNHKVHMELKWSDSFIAERKKVDPAFVKVSGASLSCIDCHAPDAQQAYMAPINYELHCQSCHPLNFRPVEVEDVPVPHGDASLAASAAGSAYRDLLIKGGGKLPLKKIRNPKWKKPRPGRRSKVKKDIFLPDPRTLEQWLTDSVSSTMDPLLYPKKGKTSGSCFECHIQTGEKDKKTGLAIIPNPQIPTIWLKHSKFDHKAHRVLTCASCHLDVDKSEVTTDVLLPKIESCQICHSPEGGARSGCVECHIYHDKTQTNFSGWMSIDELKPDGKRGAIMAKPPQPNPKTENLPPEKKEEESVKEAPPEPEKKPVAVPVKPEKVKDPVSVKEPVEVKKPPPTEVKPKEKSAEKVTPVAAPKKAIQAGNAVLCPTCGLRWPSRARFCARCGTDLTHRK